MKLATITISYGATQSLPEYANVKPLITLSATLDDGDDPADVEALLWQHAKQSVYAQIDDALEANDRPAKYDPAPRYQVMRSYNHDYGPKSNLPPLPLVVVVLPADARLDAEIRTRFTTVSYGASQGLRYAHAMRVAAESARAHDAALIDCADGSLDRLTAALEAKK